MHQLDTFDGRRALGFVYPRLTPRRIQTWWSGGEMANPTIMRDGQWLN